MDYALLGYKIDSSPLISGKRHLREFGEEGARAGRSTERMGVAAKKGLGMVAIAATAALGALASVGTAVNTISQFEGSISKLGAVSGATADQMTAMRDIARDLGATTEFSAQQAADGLTFLAMAGFSASESMAAIPAVLDLATASGMGLAEAADTASNIMSGFGIEAQNSAQVADILAAASSRANTDVSQLGQAMSTVAPISSALGISLADTAAAIGVLSDAGIQGARAGTAMRGVLASLAGPTAEAEQVINRLGLTIEDINPETNELSVVMGRLGDAGLTTADAMTVFGREAASGALVLVEGAKRLGEFGDELERVDGAAGDMADTMRNNLGGDIKELQSAVSGLILSLGDAGLTAVLRGVVQAITGITSAVAFVVDAVSSLGSAMGGLVFGADKAQIATDNLTLAMGDEIGQANKLVMALNEGRLMSVDVAGVKLEQAQAHLAAADAARQDAVAQVKLSEGYQRQQAIIEDNRRILQQYEDLKAQGEVAGQFEADQIAELNRQLRVAVAAQEEMVSAVGEAGAEYQSIQGEIAILRDAIANAENGMVSLGGEIVTANELSARLSSAIDGVSFGNSIAGADALAQRLGVSLELAMKIAAVAGSSGVGDEVFDPRSPLFNQSAQDEANREARLAEIRDSFEEIGAAASASRGPVGGLSTAVSGLGDDVEETSSDVVTFAGVFEDSLLAAMRNTSDIFADGWEGIVDKIKNSLLDAAKFALLNPIKVSLGIGGTATGAGMLGSLGGSGIMSGLSAASGAFGSGLAVAGNGLLAGGLGGAATASMGAITGGIGMGGIAGFATAAGAALPWVAGAAAIVSFFSSKSKLVDSGIRATVDMENSIFESFEKIEKSRFWGMSKSTNTKYSALSNGEGDPLALAVGQVQDGALKAVNSLGLSGDIFDGFTTQFKISLKGLDDAAREAAVSDALKGLGNDMAALVPDLQGYALANEAAYDTLTRLSETLTSVNGVFENLGFGIYNASLAGADGAVQFANLFESLEGFSSATSAYYETFYSDQEKLANSTRQMSAILSDLGVNVMPSTNAAFRDLVDTAMLAGDSDLAAELIKIAPAFASVTDAANNLANSLVASVNEDVFSDGLEYQRALARASNGLEYSPGQRDAEMVAELRALRADVALLQSTSEITAANTGKAADNTENQLAITEESML